MIRDPYKPSRYFEKYLSEQESRITMFSNKLGELESKGLIDKARQCHGFLVNLFRDKIYAQYSSGCEVSVLKDSFLCCLEHIKGNGSMTYDTSLQVFSWSILFEIDIRETLEAVEYPRDSFIEALEEYAKRGVVKTPIAIENLCFPQSTKKFAECLNGQVSAEELSKYIDVFWYHDNKGASWYESDKSTTDIYCGYWCFLGAAIAQIMRFNLAAFADIRFFPEI